MIFIAWKRMCLPTPLFFQKVRNVALLLSSLGTAVLSSPVIVHPEIKWWAGCCITIGTIMSACCQFMVTERYFKAQ